MLESNGRTIVIDGLSVTLLGDPTLPAVLMSSGLGGLGAYWKPQLSSLLLDHFVLLYDQRGTGKSDRALPGDFCVAHMARDLASILGELKIPQAHVVGHAAGGIAGLELAVMRPDLVHSLTVVNGWAQPDRHFQRCFEIRLAIYESGGPEAYLRAQPLFLFPASWISDHLHELDQHAADQASSFQHETALKSRIGALQRFDILQNLGQVQSPVLLISAKDDMLVPSRCSQVLLSNLPNASWIEMPWGGHAVNVTATHEFDQHLLKFITSH